MISVVTDSLSGEFVIVTNENQTNAKRLSKQHVRILRMLAMDTSIAEIGRALNLSEGAVKVHIHKICECFDAENHIQVIDKTKDLELFEVL